MRYYSTQRPVTPGSFPSGYAVEEIVNFDRKTHCDEIGRTASCSWESPFRFLASRTRSPHTLHRPSIFNTCIPFRPSLL